MVFTYKGNELGSFFGMSDNYPNDTDEYGSYKNLISIIWNRSEEDAIITVDGVDNVLKNNFMTTTTYFQKVTYKKGNPALIAFSFNREFYCINDHDHEVSCNGIIFMGRQEAPIIKLSNEDTEKFEMLYFPVFLAGTPKLNQVKKRYKIPLIIIGDDSFIDSLV